MDAAEEVLTNQAYIERRFRQVALGLVKLIDAYYIDLKEKGNCGGRD